MYTMHVNCKISTSLLNSRKHQNVQRNVNTRCFTKENSEQNLLPLIAFVVQTQFYLDTLVVHYIYVYRLDGLG